MMKMGQLLYQDILAAMREAYDAEAYAQCRAAGLSEERCRWDLFHRACGAGGAHPDLSRCAYQTMGLKDTHIDTALRKVMRALKRPVLPAKNDYECPHCGSDCSGECEAARRNYGGLPGSW